MKNAPLPTASRKTRNYTSTPSNGSLQKIWFLGLLTLALGAGGWYALNAAVSAAPSPSGSGKFPTGSSANEILGALPVSAHPSKIDAEVAKWTEKARLNPKDIAAWNALGDTLMQKGRETADSAYYLHSEKAYQTALNLNSKSESANLGLAWVNSGRHEFEKSIEWANRAIAINASCNEAYGLIGDAAVEMGDWPKAYESYQKMMDLRPDLASYSRGAHLVFLNGDIRKGMFLMNKAIKAGSPYAENTVWCRAQLGLMLYKDGYLVPAEQILTQAIKLAPNNYAALNAMGRVKAARKDYPAAISFYKKALAIAPQHETLVALGDLYLLTGNKAEAQKQFDLVESIHKINQANGVKGDSQLALFYADHDRNLPEALKMAEAEYKTRPNLYVTDALAWCYFKNGRLEEAEKTIKLALQRDTPEALFHYHAGMIYARMGDRADASKQLYRAVNMCPNFQPLAAKEAIDTMARLASISGRSASSTNATN